MGNFSTLLVSKTFAAACSCLPADFASEAVDVVFRDGSNFVPELIYLRVWDDHLGHTLDEFLSLPD